MERLLVSMHACTALESARAYEGEGAAVHRGIDEASSGCHERGIPNLGIASGAMHGRS